MYIYNLVLNYAVWASLFYLLYDFSRSRSKKEMGLVFIVFLVITFFNTETMSGMNIFWFWLTERLGGTSLAAKIVSFIGIGFLGFLFWNHLRKKTTKTLTKWVLTSVTITATLLIWDLLLRPQGKGSYEDILYVLLLPNLSCAIIASIYFWSKLQNELAVWVGFVIFLVLANMTYALCYGISLADKLGPNPRDWMAGFIMLGVFLTFNTVLYRYSIWYKRLSYKCVKWGLIIVFFVSAANLVFQIAGDRTSVEAKIRAHRNQMVLVYNQKMIALTAQKSLAGSKIPEKDVLEWAKKQNVESLIKYIKKTDKAIEAVRAEKPNLPDAIPLSDSEITVHKVKSLFGGGWHFVESVYAAVAGQTLRVGENVIVVNPGEESNTLEVPAGYNFDIKFPSGKKFGEDYFFLPQGKRNFKFSVAPQLDRSLSFEVKVWPKPQPKSLPVKIYGKGRHPLPPLKAGEMMNFWAAAKKYTGKRWGITSSKDFKFRVFFDDGTSVEAWKIKNWPSKSRPKFRIKAITDQPNLVFYIK